MTYIIFFYTRRRTREKERERERNREGAGSIQENKSAVP